MKDAILNGSIRVLIRHGLNNWTVEEVAKQARCAKGLVNYHYGSKQHLLQRSAETLRDDRLARRRKAVTSPGSSALDELWMVLLDEVKSGRFAAWLSLLAADPPLRAAAAAEPTDALTFASTLEQSLGLDGQLAPQAGTIEAALNGLQLRLLQGAPPGETEEAYHRFCLTILSP